MTSRNICQTGSFPNADFYQIVCDCTDGDHDISLVMEVDDGLITLTFYKKLWAKAIWCPTNWFEKFKDVYGRVKIAWNVLTKGYVECEGEFIVQSEQAIDDLMTALAESKTKMMLQREAWIKRCTSNEE